jgi:basic amino acid/polyamine antiporter, APA family
VALPVLRRRDALAAFPPAMFRVPGGAWVVGTALLVIAWLVAHASMQELRNVAIAMLVGGALMWLAGRAAHRGTRDGA